MATISVEIAGTGSFNTGNKTGVASATATVNWQGGRPAKVDLVTTESAIDRNSGPGYFVGSPVQNWVPPGKFKATLTINGASDNLNPSNPVDETFTGLDALPVSGFLNPAFGMVNGDVSVKINVTEAQDSASPPNQFNWSAGGNIIAYYYDIQEDCTDGGWSSDPVQYATGNTRLSFDDFSPSDMPVLKLDREYASQGVQANDPGVNLGGRMSLAGLPRIIAFSVRPVNEDSEAFDHVGIDWSATQAWACLEIADGSGSPSGQYENSNTAPAGKLTHDGVAKKYTWTGADGSQATFNDFDDSWSTNQRGRVTSFRRASGESATLTWTSAGLTDITWSRPASPGGTVETETYAFTRDNSSLPGYITKIAQSRQGNAVRTVEYVYYDESTSHEAKGSAGDLQFVRVRNGDITAPVIERQYYRWYTHSWSSRQLKLWLSDRSFHLAAKDLDTGDPDTDGGEAAIDAATDNPNQLLPYADNYFEYTQTGDGAQSWKVAKEVAQGAGHGCSACGTAGQGSYTFEYHKNTSPGPGRNAWFRRTTEKLLKAGSSTEPVYQNIVYTNAWAQPVLSVRKQGESGPEFYTWYKYDGRGQLILKADNSAINGYDEAYHDLVHRQAGLSTTTYPTESFLSASSGKIEFTNYYTSDDGVSAELYIYPKERGVKRGETGAEIKTRSWTYTDGGVAGDGAWYVATETEYPSATDQTIKNVTSYEYVSWHQVSSQNTAQVLKRITHLPQVKYTQNGKDTVSGSGSNEYVVEEYFDKYGNLTWRKDAEGRVDYFEYDPLSGSMTREIRDVNPAAISNPTVAGPGSVSGALGLETVTVVDGLGRPLRVTDPNGHVTHIVYDDLLDDNGDGVVNDSVVGGVKDDPREVRTYIGWDSSTKLPTGPVHVRIEGPAKDGSSNAEWIADELTFSWTGSGGLPVANGKPNGSESLTSTDATIQSLQRQRYNRSKQVVERDRYVSLPTGSYLSSGGLVSAYGTGGTHYHAQSLAYNSQGLLYKTKTANGTYSMMTYDGRGNLTGEWVGTNITNSTETDPEGNGNTTNNMEKVAAYEYGDGNEADGQLSRVTRYPGDGTANRVSEYFYDWRHRLVATRRGVVSFATAMSDSAQLPASGGGSVTTTGSFATWPAAGFALVRTSAGGTREVVYYSSRTSTTLTVGSTGRGQLGTSAGAGAATDTVEALGNHADNARPVLYRVLDNLGRAVERSAYDGDLYLPSSTSGVPDAPVAASQRTKSTTEYDAQGRVFREVVYPVTYTLDGQGAPVSATVGTGGVTTGYWYDLRGNLIKTAQPGGLVTKAVYDNASRMIGTYQTDGGGDVAAGSSGTWAHAGNRSDDKVLEQTTYTLDDVGNVLLTTSKQRNHLETATGDLGSASTAPKARVSYLTYYYDRADRVLESVNVGTNGGSAYTRPTSEPSRSATVLVTSYTYDAGGRVKDVTNPRGHKTAYGYDLAGQRTRMVEAFTGSTVASAVPAVATDRITDYFYDGSGHLTRLQAVLPDGSDSGTAYDKQTTDYIYDVVGGSGNSALFSKDLLSEVRYPNLTTDDAGTTAAYKESTLYNRLGERTQRTDRNGTIRWFQYDVLGRLTNDYAHSVASGLKASIRELSYTFDSAGRLFQATSHAARVNGVPASGSVGNQVRRLYNGFGQLVTEYQAHDGAVSTSSTPKVEYAYSEAAGGANHSRLTSMTYPSGAVLGSVYATGLSSAISRVSSLTLTRPGESAVTVESYEYLGESTWVKRLRPENNTELSYDSGFDSVTGDAGDRYVGLDRFGRIVDQHWKVTGGATIDRFQYGYDRTGNVVYKHNRNTSDGRFSELYSADSVDGNSAYDALDRLQNFQRGELSDSNGSAGLPYDRVIAAQSRNQDWTLDALGNWDTLAANAGGDSRTHNRQNQIVTQTPAGGSAATFVYDNNGNLKDQSSSSTTSPEYRYDAWDRFVEFKTEGTTITASIYEYPADALGRRILDVKFVDYGGSLPTHPEFDRAHLYYSDRWQVVEDLTEVTAGGSTAPITTTVNTQVWSPGYVDDLVLRDQSVTIDDPENGSSTTLERLYAQHDHNFNVTSLSDTSGGVIDRVLYDPYGAWTATDPSYVNPSPDRLAGKDWVHLHQGGRYNHVNGLYHFRHRDYAAGLGRWMRQDPAGYVDGASLYQAYGSGPVGRQDAYGLETDDFGVYWNPNVDWTQVARPDGFVPGKGFPPSHPKYNTRPDLDQRRIDNADKCPRQPCSQCWIDFRVAQADILSSYSPTQTGIAGAGKGIIVGAGVKGGTAIAAHYTGSIVLGPIGWAGAGVAAVGSAGIGFWEASWVEQAKKDAMKTAETNLKVCLKNCKPG